MRLNLFLQISGQKILYWRMILFSRSAVAIQLLEAASKVSLRICDNNHQNSLKLYTDYGD